LWVSYALIQPDDLEFVSGEEQPQSDTFFGGILRGYFWHEVESEDRFRVAYIIRRILSQFERIVFGVEAKPEEANAEVVIG
jgi:hypothetical protein